MISLHKVQYLHGLDDENDPCARYKYSLEYELIQWNYPAKSLESLEHADHMTPRYDTTQLIYAINIVDFKKIYAKTETDHENS